jgi:hypothetical protein
MPESIDDIIQSAANSGVRVSDLLRRSMVVAQLGGHTEMRAWIQLELNGYPDGDPIPEYRRVRSQSYVRRPDGQLLPFDIRHTETWQYLESVPMNTPLAQIEKAAEQTTGGVLVFYHEKTEAELQRVMTPQGPFRPLRYVSSAQMGVLVEAVRNRILSDALSIVTSAQAGAGITHSSPIVDGPSTVQNIETYVQMNITAPSQVIVGGSGNSIVLEPERRALLEEISAIRGHIETLTADAAGRSQAIAKLEALRLITESSENYKLETAPMAKGVKDFLFSVSVGYATNHIPTLTAIAALAEKHGWWANIVSFFFR